MGEPIIIIFERNDPLWDFYAHYGHLKRVGHAGCVLQGNRLLLGDLLVHDAYEIRWPRFDRIRIMLRIPAKKRNFRHVGIGGRLLARVIHEAQEAEIAKIWGSVTAGDIKAFPSLSDWYGRRGFDVLEADAECLLNAVKKVIWRNRGDSEAPPSYLLKSFLPPRIRHTPPFEQPRPRGPHSHHSPRNSHAQYRHRTPRRNRPPCP